MAQKKKSAQPKPRAAEPRMYGDGQPSQAAAQSTTQPTATPVEPAVRTAGQTPRASSRAGASGSFARADKISDYSYVKADLRRLGITAVGILAILVVLGIVIP